MNPSREVTKDEFYKAIGPLDVHPRIQGPYPYTSVFLTPQRHEVGRIVSAYEKGRSAGLTQDSYFLNASRP